jgi:hypothetical protein
MTVMEGKVRQYLEQLALWVMFDQAAVICRPRSTV